MATWTNHRSNLVSNIFERHETPAVFRYHVDDCQLTSFEDGSVYAIVFQMGRPSLTTAGEEGSVWQFDDDERGDGDDDDEWLWWRGFSVRALRFRSTDVAWELERARHFSTAQYFNRYPDGRFYLENVIAVNDSIYVFISDEKLGVIPDVVLKFTRHQPSDRLRLDQPQQQPPTRQQQQQQQHQPQQRVVRQQLSTQRQSLRGRWTRARCHGLETFPGVVAVGNQSPRRETYQGSLVVGDSLYLLRDLVASNDDVDGGNDDDNGYYSDRIVFVVFDCREERWRRVETQLAETLSSTKSADSATMGFLWNSLRSTFGDHNAVVYEASTTRGEGAEGGGNSERRRRSRRRKALFWDEVQYASRERCYELDVAAATWSFVSVVGRSPDRVLRSKQLGDRVFVTCTEEPAADAPLSVAIFHVRDASWTRIVGNAGRVPPLSARFRSPHLWIDSFSTANDDDGDEERDERHEARNLRLVTLTERHCVIAEADWKRCILEAIGERRDDCPCDACRRDDEDIRPLEEEEEEFRRRRCRRRGGGDDDDGDDVDDGETFSSAESSFDRFYRPIEPPANEEATSHSLDLSTTTLYDLAAFGPPPLTKLCILAAGRNGRWNVESWRRRTSGNLHVDFDNLELRLADEMAKRPREKRGPILTQWDKVAEKAMERRIEEEVWDD